MYLLLRAMSSQELEIFVQFQAMTSSGFFYSCHDLFCTKPQVGGGR
jgi:hypothetical protein